ncbi:hypothetical protein [Kitasatospora sp. NPDC001175]
MYGTDSSPWLKTKPPVPRPPTPRCRNRGPPRRCSGCRRSPVAVCDLLRFGSEAEVLGPPELREALARTVAELARRYGVDPADTAAEGRPGEDRPAQGWSSSARL